MNKDDTHFHLMAGETIVSRYLTDGPSGRRGDPVLYDADEVEAAGLALCRAIGVEVTAVCVRRDET